MGLHGTPTAASHRFGFTVSRGGTVEFIAVLFKSTPVGI